MPRLEIQRKQPEGKMYECIAFFEMGTPKKWRYVRDLASFALS